MNTRLMAAMLCYAALAGLAGFSLEGLIRIAVLVFLAGLALKTFVAAKIQSL